MGTEGAKSDPWTYQCGKCGKISKLLIKKKFSTLFTNKKICFQFDGFFSDFTGKDFKTKAERDQHMISCKQEPTPKGHQSETFLV